MATVVSGTTLASTTDTDAYTSASFTPAVGDLIVVVTYLAGTAAAAVSCGSTGQGGLAFVTWGSGTFGTARVFVHVAGNLCTAAAGTTISVLGANLTSDPATGCLMFVARAAGMTLTGVDAIRQAVSGNGNAANAPTLDFDEVCRTGNPTIAVMHCTTNPPNVAPPTNWTERADTGFATPSVGGEWASRNSGFTGQTVLWAGSVATNWLVNLIELDIPLDFAQPVDDSATPSDGIVKKPHRKPADTMSLADSSLRGPRKGLGETPAVADAVQDAIALTKPETIALSDGQAKLAAFLRTNADTATPSDATAKAPHPYPADSSSPSDAIVKAPGLWLPDSATPSDASLRSPRKVIAEAPALTDSVQDAYGMTKGDTVAVSDSAARTAVFIRAVDDALSLADSIQAAMLLLKAIDDLLSLADAQAKDVGQRIADTAAPTEGFSLAPGLFPADSETLSDARVAVVAKLLVESPPVADAVQDAYGLSKGDSVSISDSSSTFVEFVRSVAEAALTTSDDLDSLLAGGLTLGDSVDLSDSISKATGLNQADSAALQDVIDRAWGIGYSLGDNLSLADAVQDVIAVLRVEALGLDDEATSASEFERELDDPATAEDEASLGAGQVTDDSIGSADDLAVTFGLRPEDLVSLADALSHTQDFGLILDEPIIVADAVQEAIALSVTEVLGLADSTSPDSVFTRTLSDPATLGDSIAAAFGKRLAEAAAIADAFQQSAGWGREISDSVSPVDAARKHSGLTRADVLALADAVQDAIHLAVAESLISSDVISRTADFRRSLSENPAVVDVVAKSMGGISLDDAVSLLDEASRHIGIGVAETILLSDVRSLNYLSAGLRLRAGRVDKPRAGRVVQPRTGTVAKPRTGEQR